jgi:hypothetical protein
MPYSICSDKVFVMSQDATAAAKIPCMPQLYLEIDWCVVGVVPNQQVSRVCKMTAWNVELTAQGETKMPCTENMRRYG